MKNPIWDRCKARQGKARINIVTDQKMMLKCRPCLVLYCVIIIGRTLYRALRQCHNGRTRYFILSHNQQILTTSWSGPASPSQRGNPLHTTGRSGES